MNKTLTHSTAYVAVVAVLFGMLPAFGTPAAVLVALMALPAFSWRALNDHKLFLLLIVQYPIIQMGLNLWHTPGFWEGQHNDSYLAMMIVLPFVLSLVVQSFQKTDVFLMWLAAGLMFSFVALAVDFTFILNEMKCRAGGFMMNPLLTPPVLVPLSLLLFLDWNNASPIFKRAAYVMVFFGGVAILAMNGSRMGTYAFYAALVLLVGWLRFWQKDRAASYIIILIALVSVMIGMVVDSVANCSNAVRIMNTIETLATLFERNLQGDSRLTGAAADVLEMGLSVSDGHRWALWNGAIEAFKNNPWIGYGHVQEGDVINRLAQTHHPHTHNQYLSWAVWGGVIAFASGCIMIVAPLIVGRWVVPVGLAILSMAWMYLTESVLAADDGIHTILLMLCALYAAKTQAQGIAPSS